MTAELSPLKRAFLALEEAQARLARLQDAAREPIAIIGMGCRVPGGVHGPDDFWRVLRDGVDAIGPVPADRWDADALFDADPDAPGRIATREGGFLGAIDRFDPAFFGIAPREAQGMDPQQRLLLEVAWEALEHAGHAPDRLGRTATGIYVGVTSSDYSYLQLKTHDPALLDAHFASGIAHSIVSGRLSYLLGLRGPSLTVDTACSSSLVSVHLACQALRAGDCTMALAGGVNLILSPDLYIALSRSHMLAPDGRCKTFDAAADGFTRAEGCGMVVLKRLSDARAARDRILAVIRGSAVNQDGASSGLTAPSGPAQEAVIREALARGGVAPDAIGYIEAHGTGTQLGDPLEVRALGAVFGDRGSRRQPLALGSVKTNIGHLEAAAGIAGLIKVVLALQHRSIPAHLHFHTPSPHIEWDQYPFRVPTAMEAWTPIDGSRLAGVSAFGFSGTNAHVVLEEAPAVEQIESVAAPGHVLTLSAHTAPALSELAVRYAGAFDRLTDADLPAACHTANVGRARLAHRAVLASHDPSQLRDRLLRLASGKATADVRVATVTRREPLRVAFVFTGQGAQYPGMTRGLYDHAPVFRAAIDRSAAILQAYLERPLGEVLFPVNGASTPLHETAYTQPALFAVEYALAELWRSCGVVPDAVIGHSVGEYVAACVAGVMDLESALRLVTRRGALMQSLPAGGAMAAIFAAEDRVAAAIVPHAATLAIAAVNGPEQTVIAGASAAIDAVCASFSAANVRFQRLTVSHAFHSPLVDPILDAFEREAATVRFAPPRIALISNLTGAAVKPQEIGDPRYWRRHVREAVRFSDGVRALAALRPDCIVEIGPTAALLPAVSATLGENAPLLVSALRKGHDDWHQWVEAMGTLFLAGADVDWRGVHAGHDRRIVDVPTYPFQRERFWFSVRPAPASGNAGHRSSGHPLLGGKIRSASSERVFESRITADAPEFVRQHRVFDRVVLPATAYLDTLIAAGEQLYPDRPVSIADVTLQAALMLDDDGTPRTLQTICAPERDGAVGVSIASASADDDDTWATHVTATLSPEPISVPVGDTLGAATRQCDTVVTPADFYAGFERRGLAFGDGFRTIRRLMRGQGQALGEVTLPDAFARGAALFKMHPVLLDGCVQVIAAALPDSGDDTLYLPIGIARYTLLRRPGVGVWSHAVVTSGTDGDAVRADVRVFDGDAALIAEIAGVQLKRVNRNALDRLDERWLDACLYETRWPLAPLTDGASPAAWSPAALIAGASAALTSLRADAALDDYDRFLPTFDALCADYTVHTLQRLGWQPAVGASVDERELMGQLGVVPRHARLFGRLLAILGEVGVLEREHHTWRVMRDLPAVDPAATLARLAAACPRGAEAELQMTGRVASELADALRGARDPMQLLFPDGSTAAAESVYRDSPTAQFFNGLVTQVVDAIAATAPAGRPLRILEVGGGTGGTTTRVAPRLPLTGVEYTFTDVGPTFVARARERFGRFPFMRFEVLDLERDPDAQGFADSRADVVIAANVVHATRDLRQTISRLRRLLSPGGLLVMLEVTAPQRWFDLTVGLTDGWWSFSDRDLRTDYATISRERWLTLLAECGFEAAALPATTESQGCATLQSVFVARMDATTSTAPREWTILADRRGIGTALAERLRAGGDRCTTVFADTMGGDLQSASVYRSLLSNGDRNGRGQHGVVHLWSLDAERWDATTVPDLVEAETRGAVSAMLVAQALIAQSPAPRLWIVTSGAQHATGDDRVLAPVQAGAWGVGKTLALEHPELRSVCVDLTPGAEAAEVEALAAELSAPGDETQVALRGAARHVARLARVRRASAGRIDATHTAPYRVVTETAGAIDRFTLMPIVRRAPGAGEVEIAVDASGLNFKDVLNGLGLYPGDPGPLGGECAGRVVALGAGVTHVRPGDAVLAVAGGSLASHVIAQAPFVQPIPPSMSVADAAVFPIAFLTAEFCLGHLAQLRRGERVLIHAAAGGVGMAAVKLAQRAGAEVYATAGAPWKRDLLRAMGVEHVFDSRSTAFADAIAKSTSGRGVDVVLNSLSGDQIEASFGVLAHGGRFIEIGKRGIKDHEWVTAQGRAHRYHIVDWGETAARDPQLIGGMLQRLLDDVRAGALAPLPRHVFPIDEVASAFRLMAKARHAGKIVIAHRAAEGVAVQPNGTYLITGGFSGLGLAVAQWLADRGAGRLVLIGRRGPTPAAEPVLDALRARGIAVITEALDVADQHALSALLERIRHAGPPLRGVVHSAGVLDDAASMQQDAARFARVSSPKVRGGYLLDRLTQGDPVDMFVLFSSAASVMGSPGQANHAAANAVLDALAHERRSRGLAGASINWGPWREIGAAADRGITDKLAAEGLVALSTAQGLAALERALRDRASQVAVMSIDWPCYLDRSPLAKSRFLSEAARGAAAIAPTKPAAARQDDLRQRVANAPAVRQRTIVEAFVTERALQVLGLSPTHALDPRTPLGDMGLDSLLAIELRNALARSLATSLSATLLFDYPTVNALTDFVLHDVLGVQAAETNAPVAVPVDLVDAIEDLDDSEVDRLLAARRESGVR